jgi:hypothetical protein
MKLKVHVIADVCKCNNYEHSEKGASNIKFDYRQV